MPRRRFHRAVVDKLGYDVVVDSSKAPTWIARTAASARRRGMEVAIVVTWKEPRSLAFSFFKRNGTDESIHAAIRSFLYYHPRVFDLDLPIVGIQNKELKDDPSSLLRRLSAVLGVPYAPGQEEFWTFEHHHLFGSSSVARQLEQGMASSEPDQSDDFDRRWERLGYEDDPELLRLTDRLRSIDLSTMTNVAALPRGTETNDRFLRRPLWFYKTELATTARSVRFRIANRAFARPHK